MADRIMETKLLLQADGYDDYEVEEIMDDYLPAVRNHIGFCDRRADLRFVVKFHDIFWFMHTDGDDKDMEQTTFDGLFSIFCEMMCESTEEIMREFCVLTKRQIFATQSVGHYDAFEYVQEEEITEDNVLEVTKKIYDRGLSPYYIDDYVRIAEHLQDMEDNYMAYWIQFLRDNEYIPEAKIKKIERRIADYEKKRKKYLDQK